MKKRTVFIGAILSLIPLGKPLLIKTGIFLSTSGITIFNSQKVNAQTIILTCYVKSHFKLYKSENWVNNDFQWDLEINQKNQTIVRKQKVFYEGKNYDLDFYYSIKNQNDNFIIAIEDKETSIYGGPYISAITLDLNSKKMTEVNTINDNQGFAFSNYYGNCVYKY